MGLPGLRRLDHVGFTVPDLDQAHRFLARTKFRKTENVLQDAPHGGDVGQLIHGLVIARTGPTGLASR